MDTTRGSLVRMLFACSLVRAVGGCDDGGDGGDGGGGPVAMAVDCSFAWQDETTTVRFDGPGNTLSFGALQVGASYFDDPYEGRSFSISVYEEGAGVGATVIYQMTRDARPVNEFVGQHGFTGLNWVREPGSGENLQYACFARDPEDPISGW